MKKSVFIVLSSVLPMLMMAQNTTTVTDCQGHEYPVVKLGSQYWMAENLQCTKYDTQSERAGVEIHTAFSNVYAPYYIDGRYANTEYSGYLTNAQREHLKLLYNWAAAMGYTESQSQNLGSYSGRRQGICPNGWHLPSRSDWNTLAIELGGVPKPKSNEYMDYSNVGAKLKSGSGWHNGGNGTDDYKFSGVPTGCAYGDKVESVGGWSYFWSSEAKNSDGAYVRYLSYDSSDLGEDYYSKRSARSVRCVKD